MYVTYLLLNILNCLRILVYRICVMGRCCLFYGLDKCWGSIISLVQFFQYEQHTFVISSTTLQTAELVPNCLLWPDLCSRYFSPAQVPLSPVFGSSPINSLDSHFYQLPISYFPSRFAIILSLSFLAFWLMRLVAWVANRIWLTCPPWRPGSNAHFLASHAHSGMTYVSNFPQNSPLNRFP